LRFLWGAGKQKVNPSVNCGSRAPTTWLVRIFIFCSIYDGGKNLVTLLCQAKNLIEILPQQRADRISHLFSESRADDTCNIFGNIHHFGWQTFGIFGMDLEGLERRPASHCQQLVGIDPQVVGQQKADYDIQTPAGE
jgi:hypothetical protein